MKYEVKLSDDKSFIWQLPREDITMELAFKMSADSIKMARQYRIDKCLSDSRGRKNISSVAENYDFISKDAGVVGYSNKDRVAILHDADDHSH